MKKKIVTWRICNLASIHQPTIQMTNTWILPLKISFDAQNIKEQKIAAHWPGGVALPLTGQACSQEQSLLDRT